jgi:hypothetical protein
MSRYQRGHIYQAFGAFRSRTDCVSRIGRNYSEPVVGNLRMLYWSILTSPQAHFR